MADDIIHSSDAQRSFKIRANENFQFLSMIRHQLNAEEREALFALSVPENSWKYQAFEYLESKRKKYDPSYAQLREREQALAVATKRLQEIEQEAALRAMAQQEAGSSELTHSVLEKAFTYLRAQGKI